MIRNGQENSINSLRLIQKNKSMIGGLQRPKQSLYGQYKQQKMGTMLLDYQPQRNQLFLRNPKASTCQSSRINPTNCYSGRDQNNTIKYILDNIQSNNTPNQPLTHSINSARQKILEEPTNTKPSENHPLLYDKKIITKQTINKENTLGQTTRAAGTIKSSSMKRRTPILTNTSDREVQFPKPVDNNQIKSDNYMDKSRIPSNPYQRYKQSTYNLYPNYIKKYGKYLTNQNKQQPLNSTLEPRYNSYLPRTSQLHPQKIQNSYEILNHLNLRPTSNQNQKKYQQFSNTLNRPKSNQYASVKSSIYKPNQTPYMKYSQPAPPPSQYLQQKNKDKYQREQPCYPTPLLPTKKYQQPHHHQKPQNSTSNPINDDHSQQHSSSSRREQLISKSKILRQKFNQLSGQKNQITNKNIKQSITQFSQQSHEQRLERLKNAKDRLYHSPYQDKIKFTENLKSKYGPILQNKPGQRNDNKIKFPAKSVNLESKQRDTSKGLSKQLKSSITQHEQKISQQAKISFFNNEDPLSRIKSMNTKINSKIDSIMSYGK